MGTFLRVNILLKRQQNVNAMQQRQEGRVKDSSKFALALNLMGTPSQAYAGESLLSLPTQKAQALLCFLITQGRLYPNQPIAKEKLADLLWPGMPMKSALQNLRQTLYQIRKQIPQVPDEQGAGISLLLSDRKHIGLNPRAEFSTDIDLLTSSRVQAQRLQLEKMSQLVADSEGTFLEDFHIPGCDAFDEWVEGIRSLFAKNRVYCLETLFEHTIGTRQTDQAVFYAERLVALDPYSERYHRLYIQALSASGQRSKALKAYQEYEANMHREFGITLGPDMKLLWEEVKATHMQGSKNTYTAPQNFSRIRLPLLVGVLAGIGFIWLGYAIWSTPTKDSPPTRMAVLPFENQTSQAYLADGLTDDLIGQLAKIEGLELISRQSSSQFHLSDKSLTEIGNSLKVPFLLKGKVREQAGAYSVNIQFLEAPSGKVLWAESFQRSSQELFSFQQDVAQAVVQHLSLSGNIGGKDTWKELPTQNVEAYTLYLRGRYEFYQASPQGLRNAIAHFEQALEEDPDFALAHAWLAWTYCTLAGSWGDQDAESMFPQVQRELATIKGNPALQGAYHRVLGWMYLWQLDQEAAEIHLREAVQYDPNVEFGLSGLAMVLSLRRKFEEAIQVAHRALHTNPHFFWNHFGLAHAYYYQKDFARALPAIEAGLMLYSQHEASLSLKGKILTQLGRPEEAVQFLEGALKNLGFRSAPLLGDLGVAHVAVGDTAQALQKAAELQERHQLGEKNTGYYAALIFSSLGDPDPALTLLEAVWAQHDDELNWIHVDPEFDPLRDNPRFQEIITALDFRN